MIPTILGIMWTPTHAQNPAHIRLDSVEVVHTQAVKAVKSTAPTFTLDEKHFNRLGVTDISDAMHRLPGVNLRDYGGLGGLKTVSVRGLGASHTAVIYDGIVLSDCQSGEVDVSRYSLDNVEQLNMIIGDNDDIFIPARAAASAATLYISSFKASDATSPLDLTAQLKVGSFGYVNPYFRIGRKFSNQLSMNVIGDYTYADNDYPFTLTNGDYKTRERRNNSRMNSGHGEMNFSWHKSTRSDLAGKVYYYDNDRQLPGPVIYYNNSNTESLRDRNFFTQIQYRSTLSSQLSLQTHAKFNWASSHYEDVSGKYPGGKLDQRYIQREAYASACLLWIPAYRWAFDYSGDYFYNNFSSNLPTENFPYRHSVIQSLTARYRGDRVTVSARLLGSIYDCGAQKGTQAADYQQISPSASVSFQPFGDRQMFVRLSYKNIFRMPTFNEAYFYHFGNPDVRPENAHQVNLGVTLQTKGSAVLGKGVFTADVYMNRVTDKIVAIPYNMFVWTVVNLGKARMIGVDLTATQPFEIGRKQQITLTGNYSYQLAQPRTDRSSSEYNKQIAYIPRNSGNVTVGYENPWVNLSVHATAVGWRYATNDNNPATRLGGYMDMGLTAYRNFHLKGHDMEVRGDLMNILDRQYTVVARYPMPGRSWRISLKFTL